MIAKQSKKEECTLKNEKKIVEDLQNILKHSSKNFRNKVHLIKTEMVFVYGDKSEVILNFEKSIS